MITAYENILEEKRKDFFDKYGIRPKKSHEHCIRYITCKDWEWCSKTQNGTFIKKCANIKNIYPEITAEKLLELLALSSRLFPIQFAAERGKEDIEEKVLTCLTEYNDESGAAKKAVRKLFGRK